MTDGLQGGGPKELQRAAGETIPGCWLLGGCLAAQHSAAVQPQQPPRAEPQAKHQTPATPQLLFRTPVSSLSCFSVRHRARQTSPSDHRRSSSSAIGRDCHEAVGATSSGPRDVPEIRAYVTGDGLKVWGAGTQTRCCWCSSSRYACHPISPRAVDGDG